MSIFDYTYVKAPKKSKFNLSYENKLTLNMGELVPFLRYDVLPGDKFTVNSEVFLRFAPLMAPVMHRIDLFTHYFFVPYRLIWDDWKDFITGGVDGTKQPSFPRVTPNIDLFGGDTSLADYLGVNLNVNIGAQSFGDISLLPFRAYQLIYNEYYRDQNLQTPVYFSKHSSTNTGVPNINLDMKQLYDPDDEDLNGVDSTIAALHELVTLRRRAWQKDYFTSALPFPQRGLEAFVPTGGGSGNMSLALDTDHYTDGKFKSWGAGVYKARRFGADTTAFGDDIYVRENGDLSSNSQRMAIMNIDSPGGRGDIEVYSEDKLSDFIKKFKVVQEGGSSPSGFTIHELRLGNSIQKWLEKAAIGGSRYVEQILSFFGVHVPDFTIQRPQYLGGGKQSVNVSEVLQTSQTTDTSPQGYMAGHAYSVGGQNKFKHTFNEHGIVLGIMSVRPKSAYSQGLDRFYTKFDKFDYYFPQFAHLSEQEIKKKELVWTGIPEVDEDTFGYQERYAEYKYRADEVHGDFKSSLEFWHLGRKFDVLPPILGSNFIQCNPSSRIFAVEDDTTDKLYCQVYNNVKAIRPMPKHVQPSL